MRVARISLRVLAHVVVLAGSADAAVVVLEHPSGAALRVCGSRIAGDDADLMAYLQSEVRCVEGPSIEVDEGSWQFTVTTADGTEVARQPAVMSFPSKPVPAVELRPEFESGTLVVPPADLEGGFGVYVPTRLAADQKSGRGGLFLSGGSPIVVPSSPVVLPFEYSAGRITRSFQPVEALEGEVNSEYDASTRWLIVPVTMAVEAGNATRRSLPGADTPEVEVVLPDDRVLSPIIRSEVAPIYPPSLHVFTIPSSVERATVRIDSESLWASTESPLELVDAITVVEPVALTRPQHLRIAWDVDRKHFEPWQVEGCRDAAGELERPLHLAVSYCGSLQDDCAELHRVRLHDATGSTSIPSGGEGEYRFVLSTPTGRFEHRVSLATEDEVHLRWPARDVLGTVSEGDRPIRAVVWVGETAFGVSDASGHFALTTYELPEEMIATVGPCDGGAPVKVSLTEPLSWDRPLELTIPPAVAVMVDAPDGVEPHVAEWHIEQGERKHAGLLERGGDGWIFRPRLNEMGRRVEVCASAFNHDRDCAEVGVTTRTIRLSIEPVAGPRLMGVSPHSRLVGPHGSKIADEKGEVLLGGMPGALDVYVLVDSGDGSIWTFRGADLTEDGEAARYRVRIPPRRTIRIQGVSEMRLVNVGVVIDGIVVPPWVFGLRQQMQLVEGRPIVLQVRARREALPFWRNNDEARLEVSLAAVETGLRFAQPTSPDTYQVVP